MELGSGGRRNGGHSWVESRILSVVGVQDRVGLDYSITSNAIYRQN